MVFCTPFDESLAENGPAAVFLFDAEGALRFDATWTRDLWGRAEGPHPHGWSWVLARDKGNGFVQIVLVTAPTLLQEHPRLQVRHFSTLEAAKAEVSAWGVPPVATDPW